MRKLSLFANIFFVTAILNSPVFGQQVLIDRGVQAAGLWCFPLQTDTLSYLYLPSTADLSVDRGSLPQFSYLRYVINKPTSGSGTSSITEASGGAILNFLVLYHTPEEQIAQAQSVIRDRLDNQNVRIRGPIVFDKGRYALISSIITADSSSPQRQLLTTGEAPVLEGSRLALTFELDPQASKILLESFKMATPDVSLVFELGFAGLSDSYDAELDINWVDVKQSQAFSAGASIYFVSADVDVAFEKLRKDGAIKLISHGSDASMEKLVETVYDKLLTLMFTPVKPETVPEDQRGGLLPALGALMRPNGPLGSRSTTGFGANVAFQLKDLRTEGKSHLYFKGRSEKKRNHFITFNIGDLYQKYGTNEKYFRDVPLWDPAFQQRRILLGIDGDIEKEFSKLINSVTVTVEKKHQGGKLTVQELVITKDTFSEGKISVSTVYGNQGDTNLVAWLNYNYKAIWQFQGGGTLETDWTATSASMINLYTPFSRRTVSLDGNLKEISNRGIRTVFVQIEYPFFGIRKKQDLTVRPADNINDKKFEITFPNDVEEVDYSITWYGANGQKTVFRGKDKTGVIFIDELPQ